MRPPKNAEIRYVRDLRRVWRRAQSLVSWGILPILRVWPESTQDDEDDDRIAQEIGDWFERMAAGGADIVESIDLLEERPAWEQIDENIIKRTVDFLRIVLGQWLEQEEAEDYGGIIRRTADYIDAYTWQELGKVLNIDLRRDIPGLEFLIERWRDANVNLIESGIRGPSDGVRLRSLLDDVSYTIEEAHRGGWRVEKLAVELRERYGVSDSRASLIARDQTLKLNGTINKHRQTAVGIEQYKWSTSHDERVREAHRRLNNTIQKWSIPPEVGHPGEDYQCRCVAIPVPPRWLSEKKE